MSELDTFVSSVLQGALDELKKARADVYTFSFCHLREQDALSVCADSAANSRRAIRAMNRSSMKHFAKAVQKRDLDEARMWQASVGRGLSLREFSWVNLAQRSLGKFKRARGLHEAMLLASIRYTPKVLELTSDSETLLFTCSTGDEEVGLVWTAEAAQLPPKKARSKYAVRARRRRRRQAT